jgi:hypothetical protein
MIDWLPITAELQRNPELSALAILEATIDVAQHALAAEHPDMHDPDALFGRPKPLVSLIVARELVEMMEKLRHSISWYRHHLKREQDGTSDDIPF